MGTPNNVNKPTKTMDPWFVEEGPASPAVEHAATAKYKPEGGEDGSGERREKREERTKGRERRNILLCVISTEQNEKRRLLCFEPLPCGPTSLLV